MMRKLFLTGAAALPLLLAGTTAWSQSAYFKAVTNLNPVVYYPLQETVQPPGADVEINYGSLGHAADAVYSGATYLVKSSPGATADGDAAVNVNTANGSAGAFLAVPTTDPATAVQSSSFTVEVWVNSAQWDRNYSGIVSKSGPNNGGIGGGNDQAGWILSQNYIAYLDSANLKGFSFHVFNGKGHDGAEVIVPYNIVDGTWYHLVATFDGVNCKLYINGEDMTGVGRPGIQLPMTGSYVPDLASPLQIGAGRGVNQNTYKGTIDEVAIYTNVLTAAQAQSHYAAAGGTSYASAIVNDKPIMYWRMNSPGYNVPDPSTYPAATGYGSLAGDFTTTYGTATQPGVEGPQFSGLLDPAHANASYGVAINGLGGANGGSQNVPIGHGQNAKGAVAMVVTPVVEDSSSALAFAPTNRGNAPVSAMIWFKGNPYDANRFQTLFGREGSYRMAMASSGSFGIVQWNPGNNGDLASRYRYADGKWHQVVGVYDGATNYLYVDGMLDNIGAAPNPNDGSTLNLMIGGSANATDTGNNNGYDQRYYGGRIAHFALFTNALTADQVASLYAAAVPTQAPYIVGQPATGRVNPALDQIQFAVAAGGTPALSYKWFFNTASNYSGATLLANDGVKYFAANTSQMTVSNLVAGDTGYYYVVVANNYGSVTSILASLSVNFKPAITAQSPGAAFTLYSGQQASLSVTAISGVTNALSYQWYANGAAIPGATSANSVSAAITAETSFYCIVTNLYGSATSATVTASIVPLPAAITSSSFSTNILALRPTGYWPMHDAGQVPVKGNTETNYGSLGSLGLGDGQYDNWRDTLLASMGMNILGGGNLQRNLSVAHGVAGAIKNDANPAALFMGNNRAYIVVPHLSPKLTLTPPFTLEAWVRPNDNTSWGAILAQDCGNNNTTGNRGGFEWIYSGERNTFSITIYSGSGGNQVEPKTLANYPPGAWYHVVTTYDGTNVTYYINGAAVALINSSAATMNPNSWDPITIGCARGLNNNLFRGTIDEVAVYTNLLDPNDISTHYQNGIAGAAGAYKASVLANNPALYYRMDSPAFTPPDIKTWPVVTNYGAVALNGVYTPSSVPAGGAGPSVSGIPVAGLSANSSLVSDGASIFADVGYNPQFIASGKTPFTVGAWMKGHPADASRGWQGIVSHGDGGWRLNLNGGNAGSANFNAGPNGGSDLSGAPVNDGLWHYMVGTFDGTNQSIYVDGVLSATVSNVVTLSWNNTENFIGAYPNNAVYATVLQSIASESGRVFAGSVCEAAFWNGTALTATQVAALYQSVQAAPAIVRQPVSATVNQNESFTNTVVATGTELKYQWYKDGVARSGQTNASLVLNPVTTSDASLNWYVVVSNNYGSITSSVVSLSVNSSPYLTQDIPTDIQVFAGANLNLTILAKGAVPLRYQWYMNGTAIADATNSSYTALNVQSPGQSRTYYCAVNNSAGSVNSSTAHVSILTPPAAGTYPGTIIADNPLGFWRLNEPDQGFPNNGVTAHDYWGGHNGVYTNTELGQEGYNPLNEPDETSAGFGVSAYRDSDVKGLESIDFGAPRGSNVAFSVECWVKGYVQVADAGLISKGGGSGGEQFNLDCGSGANPNVPHSFRFFVRGYNGTSYEIHSTVGTGDALWHHLCGVCDEPNGYLALYADGQLVGSNTIPLGSGLLASTNSVLFGSRPSNQTTNSADSQFIGWMADVAIYGRALSGDEVAAHYNSAGIPPSIVQPPADVNASYGGTATFTVSASGTQPLAYQWYDASTGQPVPAAQTVGGSTNSSLVLKNVQNDGFYYVVVTNVFGMATSDPAALTVVSGEPQFFVDVLPLYFMQAGGAIQIQTAVYGTLPITFQWQKQDTNTGNWMSLSDTATLTGTHSNVLTFAAVRLSDAGNYRLVASGSSSVTSGQAVLQVGTVPITFNGTGLGWGTNGNAIYVGGGVLSLVNGGDNRGSSFFLYPQYVGAFKASFTYQDIGGGGADGFAFVLQNDPRGPASLGGGGGSIGVEGIAPSWAFEVNIYSGSPNGLGYGIFYNGNRGPNTAPGSVSFGSGHPIDVVLTYNGAGQMTLSFTDTTTLATYEISRDVGDIVQVVNAETAYVGFTGASGGTASHQTISNFSFVSLAVQAIQVDNQNVVITWPAALPGYVVQQCADLSAPNWTTVNVTPTVAGGQNRVVLPAGTGQMFYRLVLQP